MEKLFSRGAGHPARETSSVSARPSASRTRAAIKAPFISLGIDELHLPLPDEVHLVSQVNRFIEKACEHRHEIADGLSYREDVQGDNAIAERSRREGHSGNQDDFSTGFHKLMGLRTASPPLWS